MSMALPAAAEDGELEEVRRLLAERPDCINDVDEFSRCALNLACLNNDVPMVRALLASPRVDANRATRDGETALFVAASRGHDLCVRALLGGVGGGGVPFPSTSTARRSTGTRRSGSP